MLESPTQASRSPVDPGMLKKVGGITPVRSKSDKEYQLLHIRKEEADDW